MAATFGTAFTYAVITAIAAAYTVALPVLVVSYLLCFAVGYGLGRWQRSNEP